jgi:hypothetical protein
VVVKTLPRGLVELAIERVPFESAPLSLRVLGQDLGLGRREHTVEPAQHRHRQHNSLVLRRPVGPAQQVGDLPDQVREVIMIGHQPTYPSRMLWLPFNLGLVRK